MNNLYELVGYSGSICLAVCSLPQALLSIRQGHSEGISLGFLFLWTIGEILTLTYIIPKADFPLLLNYTTNILLLLIIWKYRFFPRKEFSE